jgi:hypothetical protein
MRYFDNCPQHGIKADDNMCRCTNVGPLYRYRYDKAWWSCGYCDRRVEPIADSQADHPTQARPTYIDDEGEVSW